VLHHQPFESAPVDFLGPIKRSAWPQRSVYTSIEQIKLRMRNNGTPGAFGEHRKAKRQQEVFENLKVTSDSFALDLTLTRHIADVEDRSMGKTDYFENARKTPNVPRLYLELHFLLEIQRGIGF
jgi:TorA maturation chaperone TorD